MYTKEQKERALKEFERLGSVQAVVTLLGYPSRHTLYDWYRNKIADIADYHGSLDKKYQIKQKYINAPNHPRNPGTNLKLNAINRCFSLGEGVEYVSRDIGYSRASIYSWYRKYQKFGVTGLMSSKKQIKRENIDFMTKYRFLVGRIAEFRLTCLNCNIAQNFTPCQGRSRKRDREFYPRTW